VDDDADLRSALVEQVALHPEFEVEAVETAEAALAAVSDAPPDLVIMDVGLPDIDGREAVKRLRREGYRRPIIMLTAHDSDADAVLGLDSGASDYVGKPFRFVVLLARIRSQLRQYEASEDAEFQIGHYTFRPTSKNLVNANGVKLRLTEKEAAILRYLHRAEQQPVARETLLKNVWGYNANVTTHTLETHIYRLRQKIEDNPSEAQLLVTEGGGYKLMGGGNAGGR
jgi:DNA-binding response OmpR family regulator